MIHLARAATTGSIVASMDARLDSITLSPFVYNRKGYNIGGVIPFLHNHGTI